MGRLWSSLGTEEDLLLSLSRTLHLKTAVWMWQAVLVAMVVLSLSGPALAQAESIAESCVLLTQPLQLSDDDSRLFLFPSGFSFPFFGTTYTEVWINSDGNLTFGGEDAASTFRTEERFLTGLPRIAPLFTDLNPQEAGEITAVSGPGLVSFIWRNVPQFSAQRGRPGNDFAVTLFSNGDILFEYSLISLIPDGSGTRAVVGITPGGAAFGTPINLSDRPLPTRLGSDPIYEVFSLSSFDLEFSDVLFVADASPFAQATFGLGDNSSIPFFLGFSFPFMGNTYDNAVINSDGNLTFGGIEDANTFVNEERFLTGPPRIAPLFTDLNPAERGVVSAEQGPEYVTFKWTDVPEWSPFGGQLGNNFAVTLRSNGDILFEYGTISVSHAVVGISPGDSVSGSPVVLSNQRLPIRLGSDPIYEVTFFHFDQSLIFSIDERAPAELTASPNPIQVCDGSGVGQTTLSWSAPGVNATEIRIGELNGQPFTSGGSTGSDSTGRWVQDGMLFCLVDVFAGVGLASEIVSLTDSECTSPPPPGPSPPSGPATLTADPNPIQVCDGSGVSQTTLSWDAPGVSVIEIRINSPSGGMFALGSSTGSASTGQWVRDGMSFYLVDAGTGAVLASEVISYTDSGCTAPPPPGPSPPPGPATLTADPNPIQVCDGLGFKQTTLSWDAPGVSAIEVRVNSPSGTTFVAGSSTGLAQTGRWVQNGMSFYLVDAATGAVLASVVVSYTDSGCTSQPPPGPSPPSEPATLTADPNPIQVCDGSGVGQTTLSWDAPGVSVIEVRIGSPNGTIFTRGNSTGSTATGQWVRDGMSFYLVDAAEGTTLASVVISFTDSGCAPEPPDPPPGSDSTTLTIESLTCDNDGPSNSFQITGRGRATGPVGSRMSASVTSAIIYEITCTEWTNDLAATCVRRSSDPSQTRWTMKAGGVTGSNDVTIRVSGVSQTRIIDCR